MTQLLCDCPFRFLHKEILLFVLKINRHTAYLTNLENSGCFDYFCRPVYVYLLGSEFPPSSLSLRKDQPQLSSPRSPVDYNTKKTSLWFGPFFFFFFYNILSSTLSLFHHRYRVDHRVFVLTFRINVTPSSKRIPRSGDEELQRRKQSPSRRLGRTPVICSQRIQHWF